MLMSTFLSRFSISSPGCPHYLSVCVIRNRFSSSIDSVSRQWSTETNGQYFTFGDSREGTDCLFCCSRWKLSAPMVSFVHCVCLDICPRRQTEATAPSDEQCCMNVDIVRVPARQMFVFVLHTEQEKTGTLRSFDRSAGGEWAFTRGHGNSSGLWEVAATENALGCMAYRKWSVHDCHSGLLPLNSFSIGPIADGKSLPAGNTPG